LKPLLLLLGLGFLAAAAQTLDQLIAVLMLAGRQRDGPAQLALRLLVLTTISWRSCPAPRGLWRSAADGSAIHPVYAPPRPFRPGYPGTAPGAPAPAVHRARAVANAPGAAPLRRTSAVPSSPPST